jgi:ABC-2 type transport system ATP-binding protein
VSRRRSRSPRYAATRFASTCSACSGPGSSAGSRCSTRSASSWDAAKRSASWAGSGKSTLLKIVSGIYRPDRGRVESHAAITPILELGVGWNPELDAVDNVYLIGAIMGMSLRDIRRRLDGILAFAELEPFANLQLKHYSSGMSARLAYAVAFSAVKEVLILDEVFAVGDAAFKAKCEQSYRELRASGRSGILVSHAPEIIAEFCDRGVLLEGGRVAASGSGCEVAAKYSELLTGGSV